MTIMAAAGSGASLFQSASSASYIREETQLSFSVKGEKHYRMSVAASSLAQRVSQSPYISASEKRSLLQFIATVDETGQLMDGTLYGAVSMIIHFTEIMNQRNEMKFDALPEDAAYEAYQQTRQQLNNDQGYQLNLSLRVLLEQFSFDMHGLSFDQLQAEMELEVSKEAL